MEKKLCNNKHDVKRKTDVWERRFCRESFGARVRFSACHFVLRPFTEADDNRTVSRATYHDEHFFVGAVG